MDIGCRSRGCNSVRASSADSPGNSFTIPRARTKVGEDSEIGRLLWDLRAFCVVNAVTLPARVIIIQRRSNASSSKRCPAFS